MGREDHTISELSFGTQVTCSTSSTAKPAANWKTGNVSNAPLNPEHVRVTPEGARMMTLSRLNEILDAWESLTWPASRADAAAFRDRFGWTPSPLDGLLFTSDAVGGNFFILLCSQA